ncbi:polycomb group RING finger protein 3-like [Convolutriloba macropyga]|uniref:polycomb group RING finger protein 3-like n=1 Tax=Convolutriloba macropyga TaxID=536237 RepID=UPI003F522779
MRWSTELEITKMEQMDKVSQYLRQDTDDSGNNTVDELEEDPEEESASHNNYHRDDMQIRFILEPAPEEKTLSHLPHKFIVCSEHTPVSAIKKVVCKQLSLTSPNQVDLVCDGSKLGRDHSMKFVFITRWRGRTGHLLINYRSTASSFS